MTDDERGALLDAMSADDARGLLFYLRGYARTSERLGEPSWGVMLDRLLERHQELRVP